MPGKSFLHEREDFKALIETVAEAEQINDPGLVEKDYWIMHALYGLKRLGLKFQLKGGTSLSKGFHVIDRFSEDLDIRIESFDAAIFDENPNHKSEKHIESRREFFEKLRQKIEIPGIVEVIRDTSYDNKTLLGAGLVLKYSNFFDAAEGMKQGVVLEAGSDQTKPYQVLTISSWVVDFAAEKGLDYIDNRALEIACYHPEYTFVEKLQTVVKKYSQYETEKTMPRNFLRHYYDIHRLLDLQAVQEFIGTEKYLEHKKKRFRRSNLNVSESAAFLLRDERVRKEFEAEYKRTSTLYYRKQIPFEVILARIQKDLPRL